MDKKRGVYKGRKEEVLMPASYSKNLASKMKTSTVLLAAASVASAHCTTKF
jgi:hypothetical protein